MAEIDTVFKDAVVPKHEPSPSKGKTTGGEPKFPERTGGKVPEVIREKF